MDQPFAFRIPSSDPERLHAVLATHAAHVRARAIRRAGTSALAIAGCVLWLGWGVGGAVLGHLAVAGWLVLLLLTAGAWVVEVLLLRRLRNVSGERVH